MMDENAVWHDSCYLYITNDCTSIYKKLPLVEECCQNKMLVKIYQNFIAEHMKENYSNIKKKDVQSHLFKKLEFKILFIAIHLPEQLSTTAWPLSLIFNATNKGISSWIHGHYEWRH